MTNHIKVSIPRMKEDGEKFSAYAEKIPIFVQELDNAMKELGRCWEGPAWILFQDQVESDILNMLEIYDWLKDVINTMYETEKLFGESEKRSYHCVDAVRI